MKHNQLPSCAPVDRVAGRIKSGKRHEMRIGDIVIHKPSGDHCGNQPEDCDCESDPEAEEKASPPKAAKSCLACGGIVEHAREVYIEPLCFACLPPPEPLKIRPPNASVDRAASAAQIQQLVRQLPNDTLANTKKDE